MKFVRSAQNIVLPKDVTVTVKARKVTVKGKEGTLVRDFTHLPVTIAKIDGGKKLEVSLFFGLSKQIASLRTVSLL